MQGMNHQCSTLAQKTKPEPHVNSQIKILQNTGLDTSGKLMSQKQTNSKNNKKAGDCLKETERDMTTKHHALILVGFQVGEKKIQQ
jgi:hypothetical protein